MTVQNSLKRKTHKRCRARRRVGYQAQYLINSKTYKRDDVSERVRQRDNPQNRYICVARRAG